MTPPGPLVVVGGGTMGAGIAALACRSGIATLLCEVDDAALAAGTGRVEAELERRLRRGRMSAGEAAQARRRLTGATDLAAAEGAAVAIEAVPEQLELKRRVLGRLALAAPAAVLASNTSSIPVAALAAALDAPEHVLGLHFFNPPGAMRLVELVTTPSTGAEAAARARALAEAMGKRVIAVADGPGFLVNRCARPYYLEALRIVEAGAATPEEVDRACEGARFPMGPFRLMDTIGVDVSLAVTRSMWEQSGGEPRWRPSPIQERMAAAGELGRKSGRGFYAYGEGAPGEDAPARGAAGGPVGGAHGGERAPVGADAGALVRRIVAQLVNEAWFALDAGVADAADVDVAMTVGLGFPRGPLAWGEELGLAQVVALLERLGREREDPVYRVAPGLAAAAATRPSGSPSAP